MPKKPGNWNSLNCSSPWETEQLLHPTGALLPHCAKVLSTNESSSFVQILGTTCFAPPRIHPHFTPLLLSHHPSSSSLVGGTGDITSSLGRKISKKVSWNLVKHSSLSAAGLISPLMEIKCLNLLIFASFSVLLCPLR